MSTSKKIKTDNNNKIFQDIIDFEILRSIINYLLISKKYNNNNNNNNNNNDNNNNNNNTSNQYKINRFFLNRNEILNYILVSKKWYNFISLTISNNIINNKSFKHWLEIINNSNIKNYNNQNQYYKNNIFFNSKEEKLYKISFNKEFSIIKIKESIINDYFKFNLFLRDITFDDFKEFENKFKNNQLLYNRIVVNMNYDTDALFNINKYVSNENSEIISNLFKILEINCDISYFPNSKDIHNDKGSKECVGLYFNDLSITGYDRDEDEDKETVKVFKILKGRNLIYHGDVEDSSTHVDYSALFDPDNSGKQVESIKVKSEYGNLEFVEARHLFKVNQFENLHSLTIPINSFQILSNLLEEMGFYNILYRDRADSGDSENMKSELNQMINSLITCKSLKSLKISSIHSTHLPISYDEYDQEILVNNINETTESYSNSFQPLFSELNTSIERIEFDCCGLLNINTFSNLLNNKSIKYLYLYNSDFIVYSSKSIGDNGGKVNSEFHKESISVNQYLFDNIFTSPLTSIRHYKININESNQIKLIFNLILNNIFKLQLYSLIFVFENKLISEFDKEFKNLINNISTQQQNKIQLKEIKIIIIAYQSNDFRTPYFIAAIKKIVFEHNKISFNKEFSIIKIKESIIDDYFKFNLFLDYITIDDFKEIKNKFENNQLLYYRIVVNLETYHCIIHSEKLTLFGIQQYVSNTV
ncbi:hypothetical protein ACTFIW_011024 [Dictyostelium discoideum]